jgi:hypothetical protein
MMQRIAELSPRLKARIAGTFYSLVIVMGIVVFLTHGGLRFAADVFATACDIVLMALLYGLFKPMNPRLSLLAASLNVVGVAIGKLFQSEPVMFVFVGLYCLLIGYLIFRSAFLPRILGVLMVIAGLGYLTFLSPQVVHYLFPYNLASGAIGQLSLCLWLLVMGVNEQQWKDQADAAGNLRSQPATERTTK